MLGLNGDGRLDIVAGSDVLLGRTWGQAWPSAVGAAAPAVRAQGRQDVLRNLDAATAARTASP